MRLSERMRHINMWLPEGGTIRDFADEVAQLEEALTEQLDKRGYAFRGNCDDVPDDVRRVFIAIGTPCDEIDKMALVEKEE